MGQSDLRADNSDDREPTQKSRLTENESAQASSIPLSAAVAVVIQFLLTVHLIYFGVSILVETREDHQVAPTIWPFLLIRLVVALGVLIGMRHRKYIARKVSRSLCTLGLIFGGLVVIFIFTVGVTSLHEYTLLKIAGAQCCVWFALLASLGTPSAAKWFSD